MARLLLGPLLRYVDRDSATVWVETDAPCELVVRATEDAPAAPPGTGTGEPAGETPGAGEGRTVEAAARTWEVAGHHYAVAVLRALRPGTTSSYRVRLDGRQVWPPAGPGLPPSRIRTLPPDGADRPVRLSFGSCRWASPTTTGGTGLDPDALDTLAQRLARHPAADRPDCLLLLGDQVYADETSEATRAWLAGRRDLAREPGAQVADFEEYTHLYYESWLDPEIRWLLSTVPSCMIFDDHDITDDWNTSAAWRRDMAAKDWWPKRVTSGLVSYWIYQHLGNLAPDDLEADELYTAVRAHDGDCAELVRAHARRADGEADLPDDPSRASGRVRWSYRRDFGRVRLLMVDSRAGRVLTEGRRAMVGEEERTWIAEQAADGDCDHLLVGTSLPWLLPPAIHDVESWNEALCAGARGPWQAARSEWLRRAGDLEHWAAFRRSFDALAELLLERARADGGPASVCVLSGDVHHAYVAEAHPAAGPAPRARILQLTCSPAHNSVPAAIRLGFRFGWGRTAQAVGRLLARHARLAPTPVSWQRLAGPYFGNQLMTLTLHGRAARLLLERAVPGRDGGPPRLERVTAAELGEELQDSAPSSA